VVAANELARATAEIAEAVERAVLDDGKHADRVISALLRRRRDLAASDHRFVSQAIFALFRWRGWIVPLGPRPIEARLLWSVLLDSMRIHAVCRVWGQVLGIEPSRLLALGDAPNWPARAEGFRRMLGGRPVTADPWRLFPDWLREHLPLPPGGASTKTRYMELLQVLQTRPPLWVRSQASDSATVWSELKTAGVRPWVHRRLKSAARLDPDVDVYHLAPFTRGELEIQDLASQAVGLACDPDSGERWWDVCAGAGGKALQLASLMGGKGVVVATDVNPAKLKEAVRRARRSPFRNLTTKAWDGRHVAGKPGSFDGVLVDAPCSAIGTWRRNPDARWTTDRRAIQRLAQLQNQILSVANAGVRVGGTLVYSVCTLTPSETTTVVKSFLDANPAFRLDPFPNPITGAETPGTLTIWPQEADTDAMFIARMIRTC
jgi:16S rRNA (cytosine967-C5)-methyltransferase